MDLSLAKLREGQSRQLTTFNPQTRTKTRHIDPGATVEIGAVKGPGVIGRMWFTFPGWFWQHWDPDQPVDQTILRSLILRLYWDGVDHPSVEAPFGDFFGVGHCEYRQYVSQFLCMSSGGFVSYFPMPFSNGFRVEVANLGGMGTILFANINYQLLEELPPGLGRFHAQFALGENPGPEPLTVLDARGTGHYVGCTLSIQGQDKGYLSYLEAPEYIYIDREPTGTPEIYGTGLEDYIGGGWYFREGEFAASYHGVPLKDPLRSMISMYRFHDLDAVAFSNRIVVSFLNPWEAQRLKPFRFSSVAYYYLDKAARLTWDLPPVDKLLDFYRTRDTDHQSIP